MKSIIQEGSSVFKAIELAWERAGRPIKFSTRIYEQEEKNFIGMTKKQAKVAIFFDERDIPETPRKSPEAPSQKKQHGHNRPSNRPKRRPTRSRSDRPQQQQDHRSSQNTQDGHGQGRNNKSSSEKHSTAQTEASRHENSGEGRSNNRPRNRYRSRNNRRPSNTSSTDNQ